MKVILLKDVLKVGNKDSVLDFADGYAQNVLISKGLAVRATPHELQKLEDKKKKLQAKKDEENKLFEEMISTLSKKDITLKLKSNEKGHLFSSVKKSDILNKLSEYVSFDIDEDSIVFPKPIKEVGIHSVMIKKGDRSGTLSLKIE
jgi:large subunit ribosomal protein L9